MRALADLLALISLLLYPSGYWICELFFEEDIHNWRLLRDTLKGVEVCFLASLGILPKTRISKSAMSALLVLCAGNLVDRLFFGVSWFIWTDYALIFLAGVVFYVKYKGYENILGGFYKHRH